MSKGLSETANLLAQTMLPLNGAEVALPLLSVHSVLTLVASLAGMKGSGFGSAGVKGSHLIKVKRCFCKNGHLFYFTFSPPPIQYIASFNKITIKREVHALLPSSCMTQNERSC